MLFTRLARESPIGQSSVGSGPIGTQQWTAGDRANESVQGGLDDSEGIVGNGHADAVPRNDIDEPTEFPE